MKRTREIILARIVLGYYNKLSGKQESSLYPPTKGVITLPKLTWKPGTLLYPLPPVMVTCGTMKKSNIITAAWTGTVNSEPPMAYVSVRPERHSYAMIKESGEFVINLTTERLARAADLCGVKSGRDVQKFRLCRLTPAAATAVSAPLIEESPVNIECRVTRRLELGSHDMFIADVLAVNVEDFLLDSKNSLRLDRARLIAYVHGRYRALGRDLGKFGFSVRENRRRKDNA